jgi:hypothetical protein
MIPNIFFVFDVESAGLHGEGYAVGFVVRDREGNKLDQGLYACQLNSVRGHESGFEWVRKNIEPIEPTHESAWLVRAAFWRKWQFWKAKNAVLVADCAWPVEARFLAACVDDHPVEREMQGPYPLYDLSSIMFAANRDPLATNARMDDELPQHNPLMDARQSARLLLQCLAPS